MKNKFFRNLLLAILGGSLFLSLTLLTPYISPAQKPSPEVAQFKTLAEADKLYLLGKKAEAEKLYRQVKTPFTEEKPIQLLRPITDPEKLSGGGKVYWRTAQEGIQQKLDSKIFVPLQMLIEKEPQFVPGYQLLSEAYQKKGRKKEALEVIEKAATQFPESVEITKSLITALEKRGKLLEASIAARQFAIVYPQHPEAATLTNIADKDLEKFKSNLNEQIVGKGIFSGIVGIVTGKVESTAFELGKLLLQGESGMGLQLANSVKEKSRIIDDPAVAQYVSTIGKDIAQLMGRKFDYEFNVLQDNAINAFALPGGKIFVNTGLIVAANSEAELAGVMAHEVAHAVLSHGFLRTVNSSLFSNLRQKVPFGDLVNNIVTAQFSQDQERQSDVLGTRVLTTAGYAADGLRNLLVKLPSNKSSTPSYLASHPAPTERVNSLERLIQQNGYSRFAYEGVEKHLVIRKRLKELGLA
jgi:predicted Zn-dependent protease